MPELQECFELRGQFCVIAGPKGIECVPVTDMGKFVTVFKRKNHNEKGEIYEYRDADKDT